MKRIVMNIASEPLPEAIAAGDEREVQLSPFGDFPGVLEGQRVMQHCDQAAFERIVANFAGEVLVDFEHRAELGGSTEAAAWVQSLRIDPAKGLMATFRFTDKGAEAVANRRLRFLSPVWLLDSEGRPEQLISVGLTNKPNLPVRPLLNRAPGDSDVEEQKESQMKEQLIAALGLSPEASDEEVVSAVAALKQQCAAQEEAALNAEAEQVAEENKERICNKEAFKALYVQNKALAKAFLACTQSATPSTVINRAQARAPQPIAAQLDSDRLLLNKWEAMSEGPEKDAFLALNKAAIQRACTPAIDKE
ncbi:MAG: phage protease [Candidatus Spyradenecus sp.]